MMNRRELIGCASVLLCSGCATMPAKSARLPEAERALDRVCDHDLCRYWRAPEPPVPPAEDDGFIVGRCSIGLPEGL
jgi:hypothetical protein